MPYPHWHDKLTLDFVAGGGPDIVATDNRYYTLFADQGWIVPLDEIDPNFTPDSLDSGYVASTIAHYCMFNGRLYGLPWQSDTHILIYRKDLYEEAGIANPPRTWDEYHEYAKKLNDPEHGVYGAEIQGGKIDPIACEYVRAGERDQLLKTL